MEALAAYLWVLPVAWIVFMYFAKPPTGKHADYKLIEFADGDKSNEFDILSRYPQTHSVPENHEDPYKIGWMYADLFLSKGGSVNAGPPDALDSEKRDGWFGRMSLERRLLRHNDNNGN